MTEDPYEVRSTQTTWAASPGDATAAPPTPRAPEIPMASRWLWMAGVSVLARLAIIGVLVLVVLGVVLALLF
ncbi:MAG: hypothetical protein NVS3B21_13020 [Acidimicrobiales bacterium]